MASELIKYSFDLERICLTMNPPLLSPSYPRLQRFMRLQRPENKIWKYERNNVIKADEKKNADCEHLKSL